MWEEESWADSYQLTSVKQGKTDLCFHYNTMNRLCLQKHVKFKVFHDVAYLNVKQDGVSISTSNSISVSTKSSKS